MEEPIRFSVAALKKADPEIQKKYIGQYIYAVTTITGMAREQTSTIFTTSAGQFIPPSNIILNPQNLVAEDIDLQAGQQKLHINKLTLIPPNPEQEGYLTLDCHFTDIYGAGEYTYVGIIANWTEGDSPICPNQNNTTIIF